MLRFVLPILLTASPLDFSWDKDPQRNPEEECLQFTLNQDKKKDNFGELLLAFLEELGCEFQFKAKNDYVFFRVEDQEKGLIPLYGYVTLTEDDKLKEIFIYSPVRH